VAAAIQSRFLPIELVAHVTKHRRPRWAERDRPKVEARSLIQGGIIGFGTPWELFCQPNILLCEDAAAYTLGSARVTPQLW